MRPKLALLAETPSVGLRGPPKGRPAKRTQRFLETVDSILKRLKYHPIEALAQMGKGDVVALGVMTQKELDAPRVVRDGVVVKVSGRERALELIPMNLRQLCHREVANYAFPKISQVMHADAEGKTLPPTTMQAAVIVQLPPNGR